MRGYFSLRKNGIGRLNSHPSPGLFRKKEKKPQFLDYIQRTSRFPSGLTLQLLSPNSNGFGTMTNDDTV